VTALRLSIFLDPSPFLRAVPEAAAKRRSKPPTVLVPTTTRRFNASVTLATMTAAATVKATAEKSQSSAPAQTVTTAAAPSATPEAKTPASIAMGEAANNARTPARTPARFVMGEAADTARMTMIAMSAISGAMGEAADTARMTMIAMSAISGAMSVMTISAMTGGAMTMTKTTAAPRSQREGFLAKDQQRKNLQKDLHRKEGQARETKMIVEIIIIIDSTEKDNFRFYDH
jgi:hypothetical protein